jgi:hypothetical protein
MKRTLSAAMMAAFVVSLLAAAPATAAPLPDPIVVGTRDFYVKSYCKFTVTSIDFRRGTLRGRLTGQTRTYPKGYANVEVVEIHCFLRPQIVGAQKVMVSGISEGQSDTGLSTIVSQTVTLPIADRGYSLCVYGYYGFDFEPHQEHELSACSRSGPLVRPNPV